MTFREHLTEIIREANSQSGTVRVQAVDAATATRAMLDQAAEVAAASEQSALAMREAAQTAAGLIRAIEEARSEDRKSTPSELQSLMRISYAVFCLKTKITHIILRHSITKTLLHCTIHNNNT